MKSVIFDLDGVIINSEPFHIFNEKKLLDSLGVKENEDYLHKFVGLTTSEMWKQIIDENNLSIPLSDITSKIWNMKMEMIDDQEFKPIAGILDLLTLLKKMNITMAIASSSPQRFIKKVLEKLKITAYFSIIVSGEQVENGKPEPDVFLEVVNLLNIKRSDCFIIEDSTNGVKAAKKAGIKCIGFQNADSGEQDLSLADYKVAHISEIDHQLITKLFA